MTHEPEPQALTRRQFIRTTAAGVGIGLAGTWPAARSLTAAEDNADSAAESFSFGLVADIHYADIPRKDIRFYQDSLEKLSAAVEAFNQQELAFVAELGDFIDAGPTKDDAMEYLHATRDVFGKLKFPRYYVLGNHCVDQLTKEEFLADCGTKIQESYHSFDSGRYHFVVLDANFTEDGKPHTPGDGLDWRDAWIPKPEQEWLAEDLKKAKDKKTILFVHQLLDKDNTTESIGNAPEVRPILEAAGNVLAVFQGHQHSGGYSKIGGIHYCTDRAMVEGRAAQGGAYAVVTLDKNDRITMRGYARQQNVVFKQPESDAAGQPPAKTEAPAAT